MEADLTALDDLRRRFDIAGLAEVHAGVNGLPLVRVALPECTGEVYLHGGHVTSWAPSGGEDVLFVSRRARFEPGRAIRGGIPVCFPWFGALAGRPDAPAHGVVRTRVWQLDAVERVADGVRITLSTTSDEGSRAYVPGAFRLVNQVTFGETLAVELRVHNTGDTTLVCEQALHTYYRVSGIERVAIRGFEGAAYLDALDGRQTRPQHGAITFGSEVDRIYLGAGAPVVIDDGTRCLHLATEHAETAVVWNPWIAKAKALADLDDEEWREFVCVETCNVSPSTVAIAPGGVHTMRLRISAAGAASG